MTALITTLRYLVDPRGVQKLMTRATRSAMLIHYYRVKPGKTIAIKR